MLQIVFGAKERKKVESILDSLTKNTQIKYDEAKTYHDGKWLYLSVDSDDVVKDILILLTTKRKPNKKMSSIGLLNEKPLHPSLKEWPY